jgi:hypothetical protein
VYIVLPVQKASRCRNRTSGNDLGNKDNPSSMIAALPATNVEAKIHLIKIGVKWN